MSSKLAATSAASATTPSSDAADSRHSLFHVLRLPRPLASVDDAAAPHRDDLESDPPVAIRREPVPEIALSAVEISKGLGERKKRPDETQANYDTRKLLRHVDEEFRWTVDAAKAGSEAYVGKELAPATTSSYVVLLPVLSEEDGTLLRYEVGKVDPSWIEARPNASNKPVHKRTEEEERAHYARARWENDRRAREWQETEEVRRRQRKLGRGQLDIMRRANHDAVRGTVFRKVQKTGEELLLGDEEVDDDQGLAVDRKAMAEMNAKEGGKGEDDFADYDQEFQDDDLDQTALVEEEDIKGLDEAREAEKENEEALEETDDEEEEEDTSNGDLSRPVTAPPAAASRIIPLTVAEINASAALMSSNAAPKAPVAPKLNKYAQAVIEIIRVNGGRMKTANLVRELRERGLVQGRDLSQPVNDAIALTTLLVKDDFLGPMLALKEMYRY